MHNNYFFLIKLTAILEKKLKESVVSACFSQNKDELLIQFETSEAPFLLKASLPSTFSCLSFPENFNRARLNSVDLFADLIGQHVTGVYQYKNERCFAIQFSNRFSLLFKLHGNRSNVLLFKDEVLQGIFKNSIQGDFGTTLEGVDRTIDWSFETFVQQKDHLQKLYFTFGQIVWKYLDELNFNKHPDEQQWKQIQEVLQLLDNPTYYITEIDYRVTFTLLPIGKIVRQFHDPLKAINDFFVTYTHSDTFGTEKASALTALRKTLQSGKNYIEKTSAKIQTLQTDNNYKIWADLLMANLHMLKTGTELVMLPNFYQENQPVEIKLKRTLSPQKNAAVFYTKAKKQQLEISRLQQSVLHKQGEIADLEHKIAQLEKVSDLKALRSLLKTDGFDSTAEEKAGALPYHVFEYNGYKILVGKNALSNDRLTLKHSYKDDLWLHAKDVAGSHVLIKYQSGKKFPKDVIERGAELAAYFSKRKNESLCPVVVTPRKYIRKRKGDPAGAVIVEREEVIMVEPKQH